MRKPWNLPSYPVYSLITENSPSKNPQIGIFLESSQNMNVMTYIIPVSLSPKHYIIALYHDTRSLENWQSTHKGVLQILGEQHSLLTRVLWKKSWKNYNKIGYLQKKWILWLNGMIEGIAWYIELTEIEKLSSHGWDHDLYLCWIVSSKSFHQKVLMTDRLIQDNIIL